MEPPENLLTESVELSGWWTLESAGQVSPLSPLPPLCSLYCFHLAVPSCILYNKQVSMKCFPEFCELSNELPNVHKGQEMFDYVVSQVEVGAVWAPHWQLASWGAKPLTCGDFANTRRLVSKLNWNVGYPVGIRVRKLENWLVSANTTHSVSGVTSEKRHNNFIWVQFSNFDLMTRVTWMWHQQN